MDFLHVTVTVSLASFKKHITWKRVHKPCLPHLSRLDSWLPGPHAVTASCFRMRPLSTANNSHRSILALVNSAINLALPAGSFDNPSAPVMNKKQCSGSLTGY
jgi:hypothetical protein